MNKDTITALAREAGFILSWEGWTSPTKDDPYPEAITEEALERFAALVAAHIREECAALCEEYDDGRFANAADLCAAAIRSRT